MIRYALAGLFAMMALASAAQAQVFLPLNRQGADPRFGGGLYGYGFGRQTFVTPYTYGPGLQPGGVYGPGVVPDVLQSTGMALSATRQAGAGLADPGSPSVTGHPTRFAAYAGYFNSQGGASPSATVPSRIPPTATPSGGFGAQLLATPTSRTRSGMTSPSQTPRR